MMLKIESKLKTHFPDLTALLININNIKVHKRSTELENFKLEVIKKVKQDYDLVSIKDEPTFRAYRNFFWKIGIDPTKIRPAAEALTRRILAGKKLPCINTLVDVYNLASISSRIALATFDKARIVGEIFMRFAEEGEQILGIGMKKPFNLKGGEIVIADQEELIAIYPYRDADRTKVTKKTKNATIVVCGVPGINIETLKNASVITQAYITRFCSGQKIID